MNKVLALLLGLVAFHPLDLCAADTPIVLQYIERPPYMKTETDGSVTGISASIAARAFEHAGVAYVWKKIPAQRQLVNLQQNLERTCSVGWYKTPEREAFAKFTKPISRDSPMVGLTASNFPASGVVKLDDVLNNTNTTILLKSSVVYGAFLDNKFQHMRAMRVNTSDEYDLIIKAIQNGRAQLTFVPGEEVEYYIENLGLPKTAFNVIHFSDMPGGLNRYLMCSKNIDDTLIQKLNAALK